jgi:hypothetical protein
VAEKCAAGDARACREACRRGVWGKDGCLGAARSAAIKKRGAYFDRACHAKVLEGCLEAVELHQKTGAWESYVGALDHACKLNDQRSCSRLGDAELAASRKKALGSYRLGCRLAKKEVAACESRASDLVRNIDDHLGRCETDDIEACGQALSLLAPRNHDAAYLAAERICKLRGLEQHYRRKSVKAPLYLEEGSKAYGQCGLFLVARTSVAGPKPLWQRAGAPPGNQEAPTDIALAVDDLTLNFKEKTAASPETLVETKREMLNAIEPRLPGALACFPRHFDAAASAAAGKRIVGNFIVDRLGEPLDIRASSDLGSPALGDCIVDATLPEKFTGKVSGLERIPIVELTLRVDNR